MRYPRKDITFWLILLLTLIAAGFPQAPIQAEEFNSASPRGDAPLPSYVEARPAILAATASVTGAVIRVYKNYNAWWGEDRDSAAIAALGKARGVDWFVHPLSSLNEGIPAGTDVVLITSASYGNAYNQITDESDSAAQASLYAFVEAGGVLVVDMGDNDSSSGYLAPGATGTPLEHWPSPCDDATLADAARGPDGVLGTADDHPLVKGPDGIAGTADDLTDSEIDVAFSCYVAHGNLEEGISLPTGATLLMTATFDGVQRPILAEYPLGAGRVILDTVTKEWEGQKPSGHGAPRFLTNLLAYAMGATQQKLQVSVDRTEATPLKRPRRESDLIITHSYSDGVSYDYQAVSVTDPSQVYYIWPKVVETVGGQRKVAWDYRNFNPDENGEVPVRAGQWQIRVTATAGDGTMTTGESGALEVKAFRVPIVYVPGVAGSWLYDRKEDGTKGDDQLWPASSFQDTLDLVMLNLDGEAVSLSPVYADEPITSVYGLYPTLGKRLMDRLTGDNMLYEQGVTLFPMGYDWRYGVETTAEQLRAQVEQAKRRAGTDKVVLIAHSMGGLVSKYYLLELGGAPKVETFISIGTPYLGAPKAYKIMRWGGHMGLGTEGDDSIGIVADTMPSAHQLLPSKDYFTFGHGYIDHQTTSDNGKNAEPHWLDYTTTMAEMDRYPFNHENGEYSDWGFTTRYGAGLHDKIDLEPIPGIKRHVIVSYGVDTILGTSDAQSFKRAFMHWYRIQWGDGDGTVPRISAEHPGSGRIVYVHGREHAFMPGADETVNYIAAVLDPVSPDQAALPDGVSTTVDRTQVTREYYDLECPVEVDIYDDAGNHTGPVGNGMIERGIPNVQYELIGDSKHWVLPTDKHYRMEFRGIGTGSMDLYISHLDDYVETGRTVFYQVPVSTTWQASMEAGPNSATRELTVQVGGQPGSERVLPDAVIDNMKDTVLAPAPVAKANVSGKAGQGGWYSSDVTVTLTAQDQGLGVLAMAWATEPERTYQRYVGPISITSEGTTVLLVGATDRLGQDQPTPTQVTLKIDKTPPQLSVSGGGEYTVDQMIRVSCQALDSLSGLQSDPCSAPLVEGPATSLGVGPHTVTVSAVDVAGNVTTKETSFTVRVTYQSLCTVTGQMIQEKGLSESLCTKLRAAEDANTRGEIRARDRQIDAFINEAKAQAGKGLSVEAAGALQALAAALKN